MSHVELPYPTSVCLSFPVYFKMVPCPKLNLENTLVSFCLFLHLRVFQYSLSNRPEVEGIFPDVGRRPIHYCIVNLIRIAANEAKH